MAKTVDAGDRAPNFSLTDQTGQTVRLKDFKGTPVVLYFYPKDDTPGCTKEACNFRDAETAVKRTGAVVLGVSMDAAASHQKFIAKYKLPFSLLCDEEAKVSKTFGVYKLKSMYGRTYWGIERSTFVIDGSGVIKAAFRKVKVDGHAGEVLAALKAL
ncbi:MAG: thioredoxin-dependent thiol peroxidase [Nitrospiraceae bacterium]